MLKSTQCIPNSVSGHILDTLMRRLLRSTPPLPLNSSSFSSLSLAVVVSGRAGAVALGRVDTNGSPAEDTLADGGASEDVVEDGVTGGGLLCHDHVTRVEREGLGVGAVRGNLVDGVVEVLVEEELADLRDGSTGDGSVREDRGADVGKDCWPC